MNELNPLPKRNIENQKEIILDIKSEHNKLNNNSKKKSGNLFEDINRWLIERSSVPLKDKLLFFELFASIVNAGISISDALSLISDQIGNPRLQLIVEDIHNRIRSGESLAEAMSEQNGVFDNATCSIVHAGEKSGKLSEVLKELVSQYEKMDKIIKKAKSVMLYPIIIIVIMIILSVVVLVVIVPKLLELFQDVNSLPLPTRMLISGNKVLTEHWLLLLTGNIVFWGSFFYWKSTKIGKYMWNNFLLSFPVISEFVRGIALSRFARIFSFLISAGVPIIESLTISAHATGNPVYKRKLLFSAKDLGKGIELSENFADDERLFPKMLVSMIGIGESTASIGPVLGKLANYYDEELERKISTMSKLMEPIILIIMALGAVFLILAIYMPILQMNDKVMGS